MTLKSTRGLLVVLIVGAWGCKSSHPQAVPASSFVNKGVVEQKKPQPASQPVQQATAAPSPSPPQAAAADDQGWSVYESKQGGFKISYPRTASLDTPKPGKTVFTFVRPFATGSDILTFEVIVADNPKGLKAQDWALQQWRDSDAIEAEEKTHVAGREAYLVKIFEGDTYGYHIYIASGKKIYELNHKDPQTLMELSSEVRQELTHEYRKMVESFTLINQP